jgi:sulfoxide reductase heme-binding subunit YedZ
MARYRAALDPKPLVWALLAVPAVHLLYLYAGGEVWPEELTGPSGEWAARFLILALALSPVARILPGNDAIRWLVSCRRAIGVAAFLYSLLHLAFYAIDMGTAEAMLGELELTGIWTGWVALLLMLPLALTSNDAAVRALKRGWKRLQRLAYPAALFTLAHWAIVHNGWAEALVWFTPLAILQLTRLFAGLPTRTPYMEKTS